MAKKPVRKTTRTKAKPLVGIVMGSQSDWETMRHSADTLKKLGIAHEVAVHSAHRTPDRLADWVKKLDSDGTRIFIACASTGPMEKAIVSRPMPGASSRIPTH